MLIVGQQRCRTGFGLSRREILQVGASTVLGLGLGHTPLRGGEVASAHARRVLLLWLWGGPAQLDTWDPKPDAPLDIRGPFSAIPTRVTGVRIGELFPKIAQRMDRIAILRSLRTSSNDHGVAGTAGLTGSSAGGVGLNGQPLPGVVRPALGSIVARIKAAQAKFPPFMVVGGKLHQGKKAIIGEGGGTLGAMYDPFRLVHDPVEGTKIPALQLAKDLPPERLDDRQRLLAAYDEIRRQADTHTPEPGRALSEFRQQGFDLLTNPSAWKMFDLASEPASLRDRYGRTRFGQSCLLARRLLEHGVPFVQVNWSDHVEAEEDAGDGGWDHHYRNFQIMQDRHAAWLDQTYAALLDDLHQRGLLESTLVIAVGEFGRTPKINDKAGRDHWEHCYSALLAGGGVAGGRVVGSSDKEAAHPVDNPVTPMDLNATVLHALGLTSTDTQPLGVGTEGRAITELFT
jgi:hypothetical protein